MVLEGHQEHLLVNKNNVVLFEEFWVPNDWHNIIYCVPQQFRTVIKILFTAHLRSELPHARHVILSRHADSLISTQLTHKAA